MLWIAPQAPAEAQPPKGITTPARPTKSAAASEPKTQPPHGDPQQLFLAMGAGDVVYFERLLSNGADANSADPRSGATLLMMADSAAMARLLLNHGADPTLKDKKGATALHYTVMAPEALDTIPLLISKGAAINAVAPGLSRKTPFLTAKQHFFGGRDPIQGTKIMRLLARHGADINAQNESGYTVLISAVVNDKPELVSLMVDLGADLEKTTQDGLTALQWAQELGFVDIVEQLEAASQE